MQRGIDTFFKRLPGKQSSDEAATPSPAPKKRKALVISSDEDETAADGQANKQLKKSRKAIKLNENGYASKKPSLSKLKDAPPAASKKPLQKVNPVELFGGETQRIAAAKPKERSMVELEDEEIDRSLMEVDVDLAESTLETKPSVKRTKDSSPKPKTPKASTPRAKQAKKEDLESSVLSDEDRHERKRMAAVLYQKYKNRSSCLNPGSKEIPKGSPDCLKGLTFLVTGILESMEREEAAAVIKDLGGRVMTVVGKKLNYLVVGEEAGPKKLAQAEEHQVSILSEDGLFELIRARSGDHAAAKPKTEEGSSDSKEKQKRQQKEQSSKVKLERPQEEKSTKVKQERQQEKKSPKVNQEHQQEKNISKVKQERVEHTSSVSPKVKREPMELSCKVPGLQQLPRPADNTDVSRNMAWVDKYKPSSIKEIVGQAGAGSNVSKLMNWLSNWYVNHDGHKKPARPNPWAKNDDGSFYKAALLSGPPGIGKTTTATLVTQELGFDAVEFNASDTRSKRLLKEEVAGLLGNKSLYGYVCGQSQAVSKKHVLIMDEVDGMAGNEDRGGMQELIGLIKDSSVPIICMCNDRNHPKIRSLVNYCYDLRFQRPRVEQIKGRIMSICFKEHVKLAPAQLEQIITATNNDIRQTINHIALLSAGQERQTERQVAAKDLKLGPWEVVRKVFTATEHQNMSLYDKCDLFFHDYSLAPLFVQQNYLQVLPKGDRNAVMSKVAATADALSLGDLVEKRIRANSAWSLLPVQAIYSSVLPGEYMSGQFTGQINFPGWLGKNSRSNKRSRLAQELHDHTRVCTSGSRLSVRLDYAPFLLDRIVRPLALEGQEGVPMALEAMKAYHLLREDLDSLIELSSWPGKKSPMDAVDGRVKASLTRAYNKEVMAYSYSAQAGIKKKRAEKADDEEAGLLNEQEDAEGGSQVVVSDDDEDNDDLELDGLIKAKKKPAASSSGTKASTSKRATAGATASKSKAKAKK